MKLTTMTQVTIDGVMQGNGGASDEDRRNGFERGGWALGKGDDETHAFINADLPARRRVPVRPADLRAVRRLVGDLTARDVPGWEPVVRALNTRPKYVASTTLTDPAWSGTTVLSGDLAAAIARAEGQAGR